MRRLSLRFRARGGRSRGATIVRPGLLVLPLLAVVIGACLASASGGGAADSATGVGVLRTLVSLDVPISSFAQDGSRLAWMTGTCRDYYRGRVVDSVAVRAISGGPSHVVARVCGSNVGAASTGVVLSGSRILFWWPVEGGNFTYHRFATASDDSREVRSVGVFGVMEGWYLDAAGGEGGVFVQAFSEFDPINDCYGEPIPCVYTSGGAVSRVDGGKLVRMRTAPVPAALDASGSIVAIAPGARRWGDPKHTFAGQLSAVPAAINGAVQVREIRTGALRRTVAPSGRVLDLALARDVAAVLVATGSQLRIERYDIRSGRLTGRTDVPGATQDIDVAGANVVFRVDRTIYLFRGVRPIVLARTSSPPIGLSIVDHRVSWAENVDGHGRIETLTLRR